MMKMKNQEKQLISLIKNIRSIEKSVESNKLKLKQFREKNKSIDVTLEIEAIINKIQALDEVSWLILILKLLKLKKFTHRIIQHI